MTFDLSIERFAKEIAPSPLPDQLVDQLRDLATPVQIGRKQSSNLDPGRDHLVYVVSGASKLVGSGADGADQILSFQFAGDCVQVPGQDMHAYRLVAMRQAELLVFDADKMQALATRNPSLGAALSACSLNALHRCREHMLAIGRRSATERVAAFLLAMRNVRQVAENGGRTLHLVMTRREIADCLGLTVETVSRQFSKLRDLQLIDTPSRSMVNLNDPAQLALCAGSLSSQN